MPDVPQITQNFARPSYRPARPAGGLDPDMRRMALVAAGFGAALAVGIGAFSLSHRGHQGVPVILPPPGPVRVKPLDPGGMTVAGAEETGGGAERLAPAPEKPALHALHARLHAAAKPADPARPLPPTAVTVAAPLVPHVASAQPPAAGTAVQLAAFETAPAAEQEWGRLAKQMPGLFEGRQPSVERAQLSGRTIYRLRTGGFVNFAAAAEFCGKVRAGGGDCTIAAF